MFHNAEILLQCSQNQNYRMNIEDFKNNFSLSFQVAVLEQKYSVHQVRGIRHLQFIHYIQADYHSPKTVTQQQVLIFQYWYYLEKEFQY